MCSALKKLAKLNQVFFDGYLQIDYLKNKTVNDKKIDYLYSQWIQAMLSANKFKKNKQFSHVERLGEVIFAIHQLRLRIKDFSIFEIVARELFNLKKTSTLLLLKLKKNTHLKKAETVDYMQALQAFESMYERTLRVSAKDPLVFLIFIQGLYAFYDEIPLRGHNESIAK